MSMIKGALSLDTSNLSPTKKNNGEPGMNHYALGANKLSFNIYLWGEEKHESKYFFPVSIEHIYPGLSGKGVYFLILCDKFRWIP